MPRVPLPPHDPVQLEVTDTLDLHHFKPREVPDLVREYLHECERLQISEVRIIHGKGKGVLRAIVQEILANDPRVLDFGPAQGGSGWGATIAVLNIPGRTKPLHQRDKPSASERRATWWERLRRRLFNHHSAQN